MPSKKNEVEKAREATEAVAQVLAGSTEADQRQPTKMRARKYNELKSKPYTKLLPCEGICTMENCTPGYVKCANCKSYTPDPNQRVALVSTITAIEAKIQQLSPNDKDAMEYHTVQLSALKKILKRLDNNDD